MQPDLKREGLRWWRQAERDLDDARYAFAGERYNLACFLAQQSAEKALKAYLYSQGMEMVLGHSVRELSEMAAELDAELERVRQRNKEIQILLERKRQEAFRKRERERALRIEVEEDEESEP